MVCEVQNYGMQLGIITNMEKWDMLKLIMKKSQIKILEKDTPYKNISLYSMKKPRSPNMNDRFIEVIENCNIGGCQLSGQEQMSMLAMGFNGHNNGEVSTIKQGRSVHRMEGTYWGSRRATWPRQTRVTPNLTPAVGVAQEEDQDL